MPAGRGGWRDRLFGKREERPEPKKEATKGRRPIVPEDQLDPANEAARNKAYKDRLEELFKHPTKRQAVEATGIKSEHFQRGMQKLRIRNTEEMKRMFWQGAEQIKENYINNLRKEIEERKTKAGPEQIDANAFGRIIGNFLGSMILQGKFPRKK